MKKYALTRHASADPVFEADTLQDLKTCIELGRLHSLRTSGKPDNLYTTFNDGESANAPRFETSGDYLYFTFCAVNYVAAAVITETTPAGYIFDRLIGDYAVFVKGDNNYHIIDRVAIKTTPEERETLKKYAYYGLDSLASCNRVRRPRLVEMADHLRPIYTKYYAPGTKAAKAAAKLAKERLTVYEAEQQAAQQREAAALEEYKKTQEAARRAEYERQYAADLKIINAAMKNATPAGELYAVVKWSENSALHLISEEHAQSENKPAPRLPLSVLDAILCGLEANKNNEGGYDKTKIMIYYPEGTYEMRYDIETNPEYQEHGLLNHVIDHFEGCKKYPESIRKEIDFDGLAKFIDIIRAELAPDAEKITPGAAGKLIKNMPDGSKAFKLFKASESVPGVFYAYAGGVIKYRKTPGGKLQKVTYTPGGKLAIIAKIILDGGSFAICPA